MWAPSLAYCPPSNCCSPFIKTGAFICQHVPPSSQSQSAYSYSMSSSIKTDYTFLAHPPPQKKRPLQPLPPLPSSPRRPSKFSAIASWAAHVQPGSPASLSPRSPYCRSSLRRDRRPSIASVRVSSASFLHVAPTSTSAFAPSPSLRDFKPDLTTVGYTSVFLQLPNTPISASVSLAVKPTPKNISVHPSPLPDHKPRGFTHFRSLSVLRSRDRSRLTCPDSPSKMKAKAAAASVAIVKRKKYAIRPPPLANELALMQFIDGGNMDDNITRVMEAKAKATGSVALADVYRDGEDRIWWDRDEEWEYAHLLGEGDEVRPRPGDPQWVTFGATSPRLPAEERRGSVSTQDSDLDPKNVVRPVDLLDGDDLALFGSAILPTRKPAAPLLSLPSRPRRAAQHLRNPDFLIDVAFPQPHAAPKSPRYPSSSGTSAGIKPRGKARRRPAPLKLSPPSPAGKQATNSPVDADKIRKDFIAASFEPVDSVTVSPATPAMGVSLTAPTSVRRQLVTNCRAINVPWRNANEGLTNFGIKRKPSVLNTMNLFRAAKKEATKV